MTRAQAKKEALDLPAAEAGGAAGKKGHETAEKAAAKAAQRVETQNKKVAQAAGKWLAPLRRLADTLGKVLKQAQNAGERYQGSKEELDLVDELLRKAQAWGDAASRALLLDQQNKDAQKAGVASTPMEPLPFSETDARVFQKQAQAACGAIRGNIVKKARKAATTTVEQGGAGGAGAAEGGGPPAPKRRRTKGAA